MGFECCLKRVQVCVASVWAGCQLTSLTYRHTNFQSMSYAAIVAARVMPTCLLLWWMSPSIRRPFVLTFKAVACRVTEHQVAVRITVKGLLRITHAALWSGLVTSMLKRSGLGFWKLVFEVVKRMLVGAVKY